jgi:hypothetical protein
MDKNKTAIQMGKIAIRIDHLLEIKNGRIPQVKLISGKLITTLHII